MSLVRLNIKGISYSQTQSGAYALVLSKNKGERTLPIIIGASEAQSIAIALGRVLLPLVPPLRKYRPIHAGIVASAMIAAAEDERGAFAEYELEDLFSLTNGRRNNA